MSNSVEYFPDLGWKQSGRDSALLRRPPLRTGLESFPSSGSSLYKSTFRHPVSPLRLSIQVMRPTTIEMVHQKVACGVCSALSFFHNMANIPRAVLCDSFLTGRTHSILPQPDTIEFPPTSRRVQHFLAPTGFEIPLPFRVVRIGV